MGNNSVIIINQRQLAWLTGSLIGGGGLISIQHDLIRFSHMDAWFAYILPTLYVIGIGYVFMQMSRRFPGKHMFDVIFIVFGPWIGTLVNLLLIFHLWLMLMRDLRSSGKFIGTILLPNTPQEIILLLTGLLLIFFGKTSVEVIARVNDLFFPYFIAVGLILPFLLSNELDKHLIEPVLTVKPVNLVIASALNLGWYGDFFVMGAFLHTLWSSNQFYSSIRHGTLIASFLLTINIFLEVVVMGPNLPASMLYPVYSLVQHIHITDFLDRVDLFMLSVWYPITACKIILIYLAFLTGIASLLRQRDYTIINTPISLFLLITSLLAFKSTTGIFNFSNYCAPVIVLGYQPLLFLLLLLLLLRHPVTRSKESSESSPANGADSARSSDLDVTSGSKRTKKKKAWWERLSYTGWVRLGNGLLFLSAAFVVVGLIYGKRFSILGISCGFGYAICITLCICSSFLENILAKRYSVIHNPRTT